MENSKIEWTDHTFNCWWGCVKVSAGCTHCYAETFAKRTGHNIWGANTDRRFFGDKHWAEPRKWNEAAMKEGRRKHRHALGFGLREEAVEVRHQAVAPFDRRLGDRGVGLAEAPGFAQG